MSTSYKLNPAQLAAVRHKPMRNPAEPRDRRSQAEKLEAAGQLSCLPRITIYVNANAVGDLK